MAFDLREALGKVLPLRSLRNPPPVVPVVRLSGVIGQVGPLRSGLTFETVREPLERAFRMKRVVAVALAINSPGGSVTAGMAIFDTMKWIPNDVATVYSPLSRTQVHREAIGSRLPPTRSWSIPVPSSARSASSRQASASRSCSNAWGWSGG